MSGIAFVSALSVKRMATRLLGLAVPLLLTACAVATDPADYQPPVQPTITINTIPNGADISIQGNYVGVSPLAVPAPDQYRSGEPWRIEVRLAGYEAKNVVMGNYHPPQDQVLTRMVESASMIYSAPVGTKTIPAYYTFPNRIDIKLYPLPGTQVPAAVAPAAAVPAGVQPAASAQPGQLAPPAFTPPATTYQAKRSYSNGDTYVGEFRAGQLNGKGVYQFANGNRYEGEFRDNHMQGTGIFTCANGKTIPGPFNKLQPLGLVMKCD